MSGGSGDTDGEAEEETSDDPDSNGERNRAVAEFDERAVDLLSWVLDTETRARIYVHLRQNPWSTSEEVADGTGLYPSTVREALAALTDEERVDRRKRESQGAGNNPYEYTAMAPSELVSEVVGQVQEELNALCKLDALLGHEDPEDATPVHIEVYNDDDGAEQERVGDAGGASAAGADGGLSVGARSENPKR